MNRQGMGHYFMIEACLVQSSTDTWIVDSSAINYICHSLSWFQETRALSERQFNLRLGIGRTMLAVAILL